MTRLLKRCLLPLLAALSLASCIYDAPGDRFYRTLWASAPESTLGPVVLEFLCDGHVSVASTSALGSFGYYESYGMQAWFTDLSLSSGSSTIELVQAHREGDILYLTWHDKLDLTEETTQLRRLTAYPN